MLAAGIINNPNNDPSKEIPPTCCNEVFLYLNLLHRQVQEGVLVADTDQALWTLTAHAGAQTSVELHHHQFVQAVSHVIRQAWCSNLIVGLDLNEADKHNTADVNVKRFKTLCF